MGRDFGRRWELLGVLSTPDWLSRNGDSAVGGRIGVTVAGKAVSEKRPAADVWASGVNWWAGQFLDQP